MIDRQDVARVDNPQLGSSDDAAPGFIIVPQAGVFQLLADSLLDQEIVFERSYSPVDELGENNATGVTAFHDRGSTECHVRADAHDDPGT